MPDVIRSHRATRILQLCVAIVVIALVLGQLLGQPILFGFVTSGSMEPELSAGDGFLAVPETLTGSPEEGDVIVYESETTVGQDRLTTHRIVADTEEGYVTQGDANPFTDQDSGEPPVQEDQIVARALTIDGSVVGIPYLGTGVETVSGALAQAQAVLAGVTGSEHVLGPTGLALLLFALSVVLLGVETLRTRTGRTRGRSDTDWQPSARLLATALALLVALAALGAMVVPAGTHTYDVIGADFESENPLVIEAGSTETVDYPLANTGGVPVVSYLEPRHDSVQVEPDRLTVGPLEETEAAVTLSPAETGHHPMAVSEHRYLLVLPPSVIEALHDIHPGLPTVVITALIGSITYVGTRFAAGSTSSRTARNRTRSRNNSW